MHPNKYVQTATKEKTLTKLVIIICTYLYFPRLTYYFITFFFHKTAPNEKNLSTYDIIGLEHQLHLWNQRPGTHIFPCYLSGLCKNGESFLKTYTISIILRFLYYYLLIWSVLRLLNIETSVSLTFQAPLDLTTESL